jgi:glycosyltransferase involved in cell wall biosynthesis
VRILNPAWAADFAKAWEIPPQRVVGIVNAVPTQRERALAPPSRVPRLLFLGWMGERKGIFILLRACAALLSRGREFSLQIAGPEDAPGIATRVAEDVKRLGLEAHARVLGPVERVRAFELYAESDVYVLPSRAEGLPLAILEAMSAGLPVVTTRVGAIPTVVVDGENGLLVDPDDSDALTLALERLLAAPSLREKMGARNQRVVRERYSLAAHVDAFRALYAGVLADGAGDAR